MASWEEELNEILRSAHPPQTELRHFEISIELELDSTSLVDTVAPFLERLEEQGFRFQLRNLS